MRWLAGMMLVVTAGPAWAQGVPESDAFAVERTLAAHLKPSSNKSAIVYEVMSPEKGAPPGARTRAQDSVLARLAGAELQNISVVARCKVKFIAGCPRTFFSIEGARIKGDSAWIRAIWYEVEVMKGMDEETKTEYLVVRSDGVWRVVRGLETVNSLLGPVDPFRKP